MRVLAVSHDAFFYGAQRSFLDAVVALRDAGHDIEVCLPADGPLNAHLNEKGFRVHRVDFRPWITSREYTSVVTQGENILGAPFRARRIAKFLAQHRLDAVYTNTVTVIDFALASALARLPHFWHLRELASQNPQLRCPLPNSLVGKIVCALSKRVIFNSNYLRHRYGLKDDGRCLVVHNGFRPSAESRRDDYFENTKLTIVTVGFMEFRKGLDILLDALIQLPEPIAMSIAVQVVGEIEYKHFKHDVEPRLQQLESRIDVRLLGWVADVTPTLCAADILVSSARDEPFGRTLVEAMQVGLPVIASRSGGPEEIVLEGQTGILVPIEDPKSLALAIERLVLDSSLRLAMGRQGRIRALEAFSMDKYRQNLHGAFTGI